MSLSIAQVVVGLPVDGPFDYLIPAHLHARALPGMRVKVSFNRQNRVGYVVGLKAKSAFKKLKFITSLLDNGPVVDEAGLAFTKSFSEYYACSWGEAIEASLPVGFRAFKSVEVPSRSEAASQALLESPITLVHDPSGWQHWPFLLEKIQLYLDNKQSVIFLVPEAAAIDSIAERMRRQWGNRYLIGVLDKKLSRQKELEQWLRIRRGEIRCVIGTRSAVFAPAPNLGLIVIDDEEHTAYKQEQSPHYHVHETARFRAGIERCHLMYVSAASSAETWEFIRRHKGKKVSFEAGTLSDVQLVDMTNYNPHKTSLLSFPLQNAIQKQLELKAKVILWINRRGFSTATRCNQCGHSMKCPRCDVRLTYMYSLKSLVCRLCQFKTDLPKFCPHCQGAYLRSTGTGAEKLESDAARLYPQARVARYDRDTAAFPVDADIIIATSAIVRFQSFFIRTHEPDASVQPALAPYRIGLIAMLNFDAELNRFDFRSAQKAFSLLIQLRQAAHEKLLVQTRMIDDYCLRFAAKIDFDKFYAQELKLRRELSLPPYTHLAAIRVRGPKETEVGEQCQELYDCLNKNKPARLEVSDPHPDVHPKLRDKYWYSIVMKGKSVHTLLVFIKSVLKNVKRRKNIIIKIDVDP